MDTLRRAILMAATVTTGLTAGLLFGFACSVMPALAGADDRTFIEVMQRVNVAIVNGFFLVCFVGAPLLAVVAAVVDRRAGRAAWPWIGAGVAAYLLTLAVTGAVNVPLNDALAAVGLPADRLPADLAAARAAFEGRWVSWHLVRTATATASFACLARAMLSG